MKIDSHLAVSLACAFLSTICLGPLHAEVPQWEPIFRSDLEGTPDLVNRDPITLDMRVDGDFDGDGRSDLAYVLKNVGAAEFRVTVCLSRPSLPCVEQVIRSGPIAHISTLGLDTFTEGQLGNFYARSRRGPALRESIRQSPAREFLLVFTYESSATAYIWLDGRFQPVGVMD